MRPLVEILENSAFLLLLYPDSRVDDLDRQIGRSLLECQKDGSARIGKFERIGQKIVQNLLYLVRIERNDQRRQFTTESEMALLADGHILEQFEDLIDERDDILLHDLDRQHPRFHSPDVEQLVDEFVQPQGIALDQFEHGSVFLFDRFVGDDGVQRIDDQSDGSSQFMRDICKELHFQEVALLHLLTLDPLDIDFVPRRDSEGDDLIDSAHGQRQQYKIDDIGISRKPERR